MRALVLLLASVGLVAADKPGIDSGSPAGSALAAQRKSIEAQREALRKQVAVPQGTTTAAFFTAPWVVAQVLPPVTFPSEIVPAADCDPIPEPQLAALVSAAATREDVQPALIRAVIRQESGSHACAVSPRGAQGLMQLMPATAERFHVTDPFDPAQNVDAGAKFLKELLTKYGGDLKLVLGAYNAGPGKVDAAGAVPDVAETRDYVSNILAELGQPEPASDPGSSRTAASDNP